MEKQRIDPSQFTPTKWCSAEDKAKFVQQFQEFVEGGFQFKHFPKWFYNRLSLCFGMIAHYDQAGFYGEYFETAHNRTNFVRECLLSQSYSDFSDAEKFLQGWLREFKWLEKTQTQANAALESRERAEFARLKSKYGGAE